MAVSIRDITPFQQHDSDPLTAVLGHTKGRNLEMGILHPYGSLIDVNSFLATYDERDEVLRKAGVKPFVLEELLKCACTESADKMKDLRDFACECLKYQLEDDEETTNLLDEEKFMLSNEYKRSVVDNLPFEQLFNIIVTNPTVVLAKSILNNPLATDSVSYQPLSNLTFMRDQQFTTQRGIVLCSMNSVQRRAEVRFMEFFFKAVGIPVLAKLEPPNYFEGSDFVAAGKDLCFVGCGARSNYRGIVQLMRLDVFGTKKVVVVRDVWDRSGTRLWLEKVFSFIQHNAVVLLDDICKEGSSKRRLVDEWTRNDETGVYSMTAECVDLVEYLKANGIGIIPVTSAGDDNCSFIMNLGNGNVLTTSKTLANQIEASPLFKGKMTVFEMKNQPAIHSNLMILRREPSRFTMDQPEDKGLRIQELAHSYSRPKLMRELIEEKPSQTTDCILMVAPTYFFSNTEAKLDNFYMADNVLLTKQKQREKALEEYSSLYYRLRAAGVRVCLFTHQPYHNTPDACFPNNWISTHSRNETGGEKTICLYPMKVSNRRRERRPRIVSTINQKGNYKVVSLSDYEMFGDFLEGTGALCLDRLNRIAYVAISERATKDLVDVWCKMFNYQAVTFVATDAEHRPIYHTNVMMAVGTSLAVVCLESIESAEERQNVIDSLKKTGKEIIDISRKQVCSFCGNVIELRGKKSGGESKSLLTMSSQAFHGFTEQQRERILANVDEILHADISTIEFVGGGSVRCTIGEVF